jgi:hypothetical protein
MSATVNNRLSEVAIFGRLLDAAKGKMSHELADFILTLGFREKDQAQMKELAARNQDGLLSAEEQDELQSYLKGSHLLALVHSKARTALKKKVS